MTPVLQTVCEDDWVDSSLQVSVYNDKEVLLHGVVSGVVFASLS